MGNHQFYNFLEASHNEVNYRWLQPPQIAYFVTTVDKWGNTNITPVTLGTLVCAELSKDGQPAEYHFTFSLGISHLKDEGNELEARDGWFNLKENGECVISYIPGNLIEESIFTGLPIPRGIEEMAIAGFTPLPSTTVTPPGIAQCPINMEAVVTSSVKVGSHYEMFICKITGISLSNEALAADAADPEHKGTALIDPIFEVQIIPNEEGRLRLHFGKLDITEKIRPADDIGSRIDWIGSFRKWMDAEESRGRISIEERDELLKLEAQWKKDRNPNTNGVVKKQLTDGLRKIITRYLAI